MPRKALWIVLILFVVTRVPLAWYAARPDVYIHDGINTSSDVTLYEGWAVAMIDQKQGAYSGVRIEYPPGSLPFILAPEVANGDRSYLMAFIVMMIGVDVAALGGLLLIARKWGSFAGPILWILAVAALGPIAYLRLDLIPAVATIWAIERAAARDWMGTGGWIGVGAIAKLYPLLFIPAGLILAEKRNRFAAAAAIVFVAPLLPLIPVIGDVISSVLGYHADRGIQIESLWGGILFSAQRTGALVSVGYSFGALHFSGPLADTLKSIAPFVTLAGLAGATALAWRIKGHRPETRAFPEVCFVVLALSLGLGTVFSPQFLLWLFAVGAAVCCMNDSRLRPFAMALVPVALMTHAIFPFLYNKLIFAEMLPLIILWIRNIAVVAMGVVGGIVLWRTYRAPVTAPSTQELASA